MATIDPVILQLRAENEAYVRDVRQSTAVVEQQLARQEVAVNRHSQTFLRANNQSRQSLQLLGLQIGDIGTQLAAGSSPFIVLAQQGPQVANALQGTAGVAGRLAAFFSGPWGAALLAAASVVGVLTGKLLEAKSAGEEAAQGYDTAAAAAARYKSILDGIRGGQVDFQKVGEAIIELEGLRARRARIAGFITGGAGEAEARGALAQLDAQIAEAEGVIRAADVAKRNQERLAKLGATAPASGGGGSSVRSRVGSAEGSQRALESSLRSIAGQFDPALEAALKFRDTIAEIDKLEAAGLLGAAEAAQIRWTAAREQAEAVAKAANEALGIDLSTELVRKQVAAEEKIKIDSAKKVAEEEARLRETNVRNLANLYESLLLGGTQNIWDTFKRIGIRVIAETLANFTAGGGKGNILNALATGFQAAFASPGRASGGYVAPGQTVRVNEQRGGVELLRMGPKGGTVIPLGQINQAAARAGQGGGIATVRLELSGDIDARIQSVSGGVALQVVRAAAPSIVDASARETTARLSRPRL